MADVNPEMLRTWSPMAPDEPARDELADLDRAAHVVGDRWSLLVVAALLAGARRFGELAEALPAIAPNILTARLRQLEQQGLVTSTPYSRRPVRMAYELTTDGSDLAAALAQLRRWGARRHGDDAAGRHHRTCGSPVEMRPWCPTCDRLVPDDELDDDAATEWF
jgi:DNA-binding HxlR family transcriptional regulator